MTAIIILGATVAYFAIAIPFAMLVGKWIKQDFDDNEWPRDLGDGE
jgi:hypothetical protein